MSSINIFKDTPEIDRTPASARDRAYSFILAQGLYEAFLEWCRETGHLEAHPLCIKILSIVVDEKTGRAPVTIVQKPVRTR